jgi:hypothetical protein
VLKSITALRDLILGYIIIRI